MNPDRSLRPAPNTYLPALLLGEVLGDFTNFNFDDLIRPNRHIFRSMLKHFTVIVLVVLSLSLQAQGIYETVLKHTHTFEAIFSGMPRTVSFGLIRGFDPINDTWLGANTCLAVIQVGETKEKWEPPATEDFFLYEVYFYNRETNTIYLGLEEFNECVKAMRSAHQVIKQTRSFSRYDYDRIEVSEYDYKHMRFECEFHPQTKSKFFMTIGADIFSLGDEDYRSLVHTFRTLSASWRKHPSQI